MLSVKDAGRWWLPGVPRLKALAMGNSSDQCLSSDATHACPSLKPASDACACEPPVHPGRLKPGVMKERRISMFVFMFVFIFISNRT
jgi:hypothetical protein